MNHLHPSDLKTLFIGRNLIELEETDSTNEYAQQLITSSDPVEGTAILAYTQVLGKGQRGVSWESDPYKNLTFSIILHPRFISSNDSFLLNKAISLGVYDYVYSVLGENTKIKWPNDIYFEQKKVAGILIENTLRGNKIVHSIVGIGLNINQTVFISSALAASFKSFTGKDYTIFECLNNLCKNIEVRYLQLKSSKYEIINSDYLKSLFAFNEIRKYKAGEEMFMAKISGISPEGKLILETISGETRMYYFKEVGLCQNL